MKSNGALLCLGREGFLVLLKSCLLHKMGYRNAVQAVEPSGAWLGYPLSFFVTVCAMNLRSNDMRNAIGALDRSREQLLAVEVDGAAAASS